MAAHRRPPRVSTRSLVTLTATTAAAAAGVGLTPSVGNASSLSQTEARITALNNQAEAATQTYDGAVEQYTQLQKQVDQLQSETTTAQLQMDQTMDTLGPLAAAQYRAGSTDSSLMLMLSQHPDAYLQQASAMNELGKSESVTMKSLLVQEAQVATLKKDSSDRLAQMLQIEQQAAKDKAQILSEYKQAQGLLAQLSYAQVQSFDYSGVTAAEIAGVPHTTGRAGTAIAFAESKLGIYYQWGGTGNPGYDCSGLVQAAWRSAGISLPRTTYEMVDDTSNMYRVPAILSDLEPGDLIFYNGAEHVALYIGNGLVIHAPHTGVQIQYGHWNMMSIYAVMRVNT
jgi:cell wall-associated NlpC family hydrolase